MDRPTADVREGKEDRGNEYAGAPWVRREISTFNSTNAHERIPRDWHDSCYLLCTGVYITRNGSPDWKWRMTDVPIHSLSLALRACMRLARRPRTSVAQIHKRGGTKYFSADKIRQKTTRGRFAAEFVPVKKPHPERCGVKGGEKPGKTRKNRRERAFFRGVETEFRPMIRTADYTDSLGSHRELIRDHLHYPR